MSNTKTVMGQAANTLSIPLDIPDVFSTYLYTGNATARSITNGIDLAGEGGLVWIKSRSDSRNNLLFDTERGANYYLRSNTTDGTLENAITLSSFNSDGFNIESSADVNRSTATLASWTWRKAPKFFDVVTYTGDGTDERDIEHNLGGPVGCLMVKCTSESAGWQVLHKDANRLVLDSTAAQYSVANTAARFGNDVTITRPTSTHFTVSTPGNADTNKAGATYVAYLFAHNDGDGEFGPSGDQDIIKCGSYTGDGTDQLIELGFEPQWVMIKNTSSGSTYSDWVIFDNMRKLDASGSGNAPLMANLSGSEGGAYASSSYNLVQPTPTGMIVEGTSGPLAVGTNNDNYIYMAIRRGPLYPPTAGTEVFAVATQNEVSAAKYGYYSGFPVDMAWRSTTTGEQAFFSARLTQGKELRSDSTAAEANETNAKFDDNESWWGYTTTETNRYSWMLRRAPSFFDCVAYTGSGVAGRTVSHNLGVAPEMMWVKRRNSTGHWYVYHTGMTGGSDALHSTARLNLDGAGFNTQSWKNYDFTTAHFSLDNAADINGSGGTYIAYLFATLAGISKVGSYTGNGTSQTIDCGFTSGARFILVKRTDSTGDWRYFDSKRGIVAGNDTSSKFNATAGGYRTNVDDVDPHNSGFIINQTSTSDLNVSSASYIFYAIA